MCTTLTWLDGAFVGGDAAVLSPKVHSLSYATSIFEGIRSYGGRIFRCVEHLERLRNSAHIMGLTIGYSDDELELVCEKLIAHNAEPDGYIKIIVFLDETDISYMARGCASRIVVFTVPFPSRTRRADLRLATAAWRRPPANSHPYQAKTAATYALSYLSYQASDEGVDDVLFLSTRDMICESSGSNIFFVKGDRLITPTTELALAGITRRVVIDELAPVVGLTVEERDIGYREAADFETAFLCGTAMEIAPVSQIDGTIYAPSFVPSVIAEGYRKLVHA